MEVISSLLFASGNDMQVAALAILFVTSWVATGSIIVLLLCDLTSRKNKVVAATSEADNPQPISSLAERFRGRRERLDRSREDGSRHGVSKRAPAEADALTPLRAQ
jgi:hypothetical protein